MSDLQKRDSTIRYFHAYGKVCLTIVGRRILRAPEVTSHTATLQLPPVDGRYSTNMWVVGMALCLPCNRDSGTKKRGKVVAEGRAKSCIEEMCKRVNNLPADQLVWYCPVQVSHTPGQFLMNEDVLEQLLSKLRLMENNSTLGIQAITNMIGGLTYKDGDFEVIKSLRRIRKVAAAYDGSAGLYKAYKKVFNTGSL